MIDPTDFKAGDRVCITGIGMDKPVHQHVTVDRITKTMIVTKTKGGSIRRFTRDGFGRSIPYSPYGGTEISLTCKRPRKD
jgi:hypothetical protein